MPFFPSQAYWSNRMEKTWPCWVICCLVGLRICASLPFQNCFRFLGLLLWLIGWSVLPCGWATKPWHLYWFVSAQRYCRTNRDVEIYSIIITVNINFWMVFINFPNLGVCSVLHPFNPPKPLMILHHFSVWTLNIPRIYVVQSSNNIVVIHIELLCRFQVWVISFDYYMVAWVSHQILRCFRGTSAQTQTRHHCQYRQKPFHRASKPVNYCSAAINECVTQKWPHLFGQVVGIY